jgi:hypothetical protein
MYDETAKMLERATEELFSEDALIEPVSPGDAMICIGCALTETESPRAPTHRIKQSDEVSSGWVYVYREHLGVWLDAHRRHLERKAR